MEKMIGVGIDLVNISRVEKISARWETRFLSRIFTEDEQDYCRKRRNPHPHLAARWAVKEAAVKALRLDRSVTFNWREIETVNDVSGRPLVRMTGAIRRQADHLGVAQIHVSLSHDRDYAIASVTLIGVDVSKSSTEAQRGVSDS